MIVLPGHLSAYDARRSSLDAASQPPECSRCASRQVSVSQHVCERYLCSITRLLRPSRATVCIAVNVVRSTARPAATGAAVVTATRLDRRTTAVSNDRHVYTSRYHHSLSLRREKKKAAFLRLARRPSHIRLSPACHRRHVPSCRRFNGDVLNVRRQECKGPSTMEIGSTREKPESGHGPRPLFR